MSTPIIKRVMVPQAGLSTPVAPTNEAAGEKRERHYRRVPGLVRRTAADVDPSFSAARALLLDTQRPLPTDPRLVSTSHGAIEQLLLTIPDYATGDPDTNPLAAVYRDLLTQLPSSTELIVITHQVSEGTVTDWLAQVNRDSRSTVISVPDHLNFSVWAEDGYVIVSERDSGKIFFVEPFSFPRFGDSLLADLVSTATAFDNSQAPLYFQGGNVLIGDDFFFIGVDYPRNSLQYVNSVIAPAPGESGTQLVRRLYSAYLDTSRALHYVGSSIPVPEETTRNITVNGETYTEVLYFGNRRGTAQPLFHIDMFIALAGRAADGRYQVLLGDPRMAAQILGRAVWPHSMPDVFDDIAAQLEGLGFDVIRNPLPLAYFDDPARRERVWYFATSNNALVEILPEGGKTVWLPTYGHGAWRELAATDNRNRQMWEGLGFTVKMLADFHPFAENLGAVHCIKKYLARGAGAA